MIPLKTEGTLNAEPPSPRSEGTQARLWARLGQYYV